MVGTSRLHLKHLAAQSGEHDGIHATAAELIQLVINQRCHAIALSHTALLPGRGDGWFLAEQLSSLSNGLLTLLEISQQGVQLLAGLGEGVH